MITETSSPKNLLGNPVKTYQNKPRPFFSYMKQPPTGYRITREGKGKFEMVYFGKYVHHPNGQYQMTLDIDYSIPGLGRQDIINICKTVLEPKFHPYIGVKEKDNKILHLLKNNWDTFHSIDIYQHESYLLETINCGINMTGEISDKGMSKYCCIYNSLMYFHHLKNIGELKDVKTIIDVGSGIGISSIWFGYFNPEIQVYVDETNPQSIQVLQQMINKLGLTNVHIGDQLKEYDYGLFIEVVEHIQSDTDPLIGKPFSWMEGYLDRIRTGFIQHTYWEDHHIGHFDNYEIDGKIYTTKETKNPFKKGLEKRGWKQDKRPGFFRHKPHFYKK